MDGDALCIGLRDEGCQARGFERPLLAPRPDLGLLACKELASDCSTAACKGLRGDADEDRLLPLPAPGLLLPPPWEERGMDLHDKYAAYMSACGAAVVKEKRLCVDID